MAAGKPIREKPPFKKPLRDPDIDMVMDLVAGYSVSDIFHNTYLSRSAIRNLIKNKTKKPQHMTLTGMAASRGFKWKLVKDK